MIKLPFLGAILLVTSGQKIDEGLVNNALRNGATKGHKRES